MQDKRDYSIDLFKTVSMLCICLLHAVHKGGHEIQWLTYMLLPAVDGFIFVSGWYGVNFNVLKIIKLYAVALFAASLWAIGFSSDIWSFVSNLVLIMKSYWFLHCYVFMMCFAPVINFAYESMDRRTFCYSVLPIVVLVFGFSFGSQAPLLRRLVPFVNGFGAYSGLMMIGVYVSARALRKLEFERYFTCRSAVVLLLFVFVANMFRLTTYDSPFALLQSMCLFAAFRRIDIKECFIPFIKKISPSIFTVYLLHTNDFSFEFIRKAVTFFADSVHAILAHIFVAGLVFTAALCVDLLRRGVIYMCKAFLRRIEYEYHMAC